MRNMLYLTLALSFAGALVIATVPAAFAKGTEGYLNVAQGTESYVKLAQVRSCPKGTRWDSRQRLCVRTS